MEINSNNELELRIVPTSTLVTLLTSMASESTVASWTLFEVSTPTTVMTLEVAALNYTVACGCHLNRVKRIGKIL